MSFPEQHDDGEEHSAPESMEIENALILFDGENPDAWITCHEDDVAEAMA